ncbi:alanine/glycine:cation symporter family protein [Hyphomonas johnsonii]|uniref:Sodium/alanine symporter family protein n=1 Tax=Hyphomonas johnsonii MHS-2 TaxID=1280950 RepID=A0A059FTW1_9PROT|nr:amino acid carrier protein [Hyphomonas johnsonii]KCZ94094.1 sodium/alanine symporter family protein [Hyphomonas johnsonii MHS-2]
MVETALALLNAFGDRLAGFVFASVSVFGVEVQLIALWLFAGMVFFTLKLRFINLRGFGIGIGTLLGRYTSADAPGEMSPFQALSTALSGTVGLGNIAGVAIAIAIGGPGAAFWMVVIGFFAMSLKFAEVVLAVKYRLIGSDGSVSGGPMWYLKNGLAERGMPRFGKVLAAIYAAFALVAFIQIIQVNQSYSQLHTVLGFSDTPSSALAYGIGIALLAGLVLVGGARSIARVTSRLTPLMCLIYVAGVVIVLGVNITELPHAVALIVGDAFSAHSAAGGILGAFVAGMRRAVYSNEAGIGSASIAHAAVKTHHPASEGFVALLEPFIDTVVICSATALVIVTTGVWQDGHSDIAMTSAAFGTVAAWFPYVLACAVCLFAFSTILAVGYYGQQVCRYLFGSREWVRITYLVLFCGLLPIGAVAKVSTVLNIIDSLFFLISIPNLIGLYLMSDTVREELNRFLRHIARSRDASV